MLGYHLCYGTLGGWPMVSPKTLRNAVIYAYEVVARSGRRVDLVHIPVLNTDNQSYFSPLKDLNVGESSLYFGALHNMRDIEAFKRRVLAIKQYVPDFGLAAPCGFGRELPDTVAGILHDHLRGLEILQSLELNSVATYFIKNLPLAFGPGLPPCCQISPGICNFREASSLPQSRVVAHCVLNGIHHQCSRLARAT